jgi:hypothetical protein
LIQCFTILPGYSNAEWATGHSPRIRQNMLQHKCFYRTSSDGL